MYNNGNKSADVFLNCAIWNEVILEILLSYIWNGTIFKTDAY